MHLLAVNVDPALGQMLTIHGTGWENWDLHMDSSLEEVKNGVYLTAEAEETLDSVEPGVTYVIGGLVDRNRLPGVCAKRAQQLNLPQKRLPLLEHVHFKSRTVLTVNHVFEILVERLNGKDWKEAIVAVLPKRKIGSNETN